MRDQRVLEQLEILASTYPWDEVSIEIERKPQGQITFWAKLAARYEQGADSKYEYSETPEGAVNRMIESTPPEERDPGACRSKKIAELEEKIEKLKLVVIGLPPYVPGTRIAQYSEVHDV